MAILSDGYESSIDWANRTGFYEGLFNDDDKEPTLPFLENIRERVYQPLASERVQARLVDPDFWSNTQAPLHPWSSGLSSIRPEGWDAPLVEAGVHIGGPDYADEPSIVLQPSDIVIAWGWTGRRATNDWADRKVFLHDAISFAMPVLRSTFADFIRQHPRFTVVVDYDKRNERTVTLYPPGVTP